MQISRRLAIATLFAMGAWSTASAQSTIKVGALNPYSGPMALYGTEVTRGYELAVDAINASGGVLGRKIELIRGDVTNPQQGIATVEQLATRDKVDLFVGTYISGISLTASDAALRYNAGADRARTAQLHPKRSGRQRLCHNLGGHGKGPYRTRPQKGGERHQSLA
jgi:hypothetical protein